MKSVNKYISIALIEAIKSNLVKKGTIPSEYKGYISSLGASIIQSGLIPSLAFYSNENEGEDNSGSAQPRQPILNILKIMLNETFPDLEPISLFEFALSIKDDTQQLRKLEKELINASIALKLTLRTFHLKKEDNATQHA